MYGSVGRSASLLVALCSILCTLGCGSSGGGDNLAPEPIDVAGEWNRHATIGRDACGLADVLAVTSSVMTVGQDGGSLFVQTRGAGDDPLVSNGSGSVNGNSLAIRYDFQWQQRYSPTVICILSARQRDDAIASDDEIEGATELTVTMSGDECPLIGEQCQISATFSATRCPSPGCP